MIVGVALETILIANDKTPGIRPGVFKIDDFSEKWEADLMRRKLFDFFLQPEFLFFQLGDIKVVACRMIAFCLDLIFEGFMPIIKLGNMGLQSHNLPTFVCGLVTTKA